MFMYNDSTNMRVFLHSIATIQMMIQVSIQVSRFQWSHLGVGSEKKTYMSQLYGLSCIIILGT